MNDVGIENLAPSPVAKRRRTALTAEAPSEVWTTISKENDGSNETLPIEKKSSQKSQARIDDLVSWNNFGAVSHRNALTFGDMSAMRSALQAYHKALTMAANCVPVCLTKQLKKIVEKSELDILPDISRSPSPLLDDDDDSEDDNCSFSDDPCTCTAVGEIDLYDLTDPQELPSDPLNCSLVARQAQEQYSTIAGLFTITVLINVALLLSNSSSHHDFCLDLIVAAKEIESGLDLSVIRDRYDLALILISLHYNDGILQLQPFMDDLVSDDPVARCLAQGEVEVFFEDFIISLSEALNLGNPFAYEKIELESDPALNSVSSGQEYKNTMNICQAQVLSGMAYGMALAGRTDEAREAYSQADAAYQMIAFGLIPFTRNGHDRCSDVGASASAA